MMKYFNGGTSRCKLCRLACCASSATCGSHFPPAACNSFPCLAAFCRRTGSSLTFLEWILGPICRRSKQGWLDREVCFLARFSRWVWQQLRKIWRDYRPTILTSPSLVGESLCSRLASVQLSFQSLKTRTDLKHLQFC